MEDNEKKAPAEGAEKNYLDAINELKSQMDGMVSKEEYNTLLQQNKQLLDTVVSGRNPSSKEGEGDVRTDEDLIKTIKNPNVSNREGWGAILELRNRMFKEKGIDPFIGKQGRNDPMEITQADIDGAQAFADILQDCLDKSEDDHDLFNTMLANRINGYPIPKKK